MRKGVLLAFSFLLSALSLVSQVNRYGTPLITSFDALRSAGGLRILTVAKDSRGVLYFGFEEGGIATYDGSRWGLIETPGAVTTLLTDSRGVLWAGGRGQFGVVEPDSYGRLTYHSMMGMMPDSAGITATGTIRAAAADSNIICLTDGRRLYTIRGESSTAVVTDLAEQGGLTSVSAMIFFDRRLIIADDRAGLFTLQDSLIVALAGGGAAGGSPLVGLIPFDRERVLVAYSGRAPLLFNVKSGTISGTFAEDEWEVAAGGSTLRDIVLLPGNMVAAGFGGRGGVALFSHDGRLVQHISARSTILHEAPVTAMYCDHSSNSQLWFCTEGYINKACITLPASGFDGSAGLIAATGPVAPWGDELIAATRSGLSTSYTDRSGMRRFRAAIQPGTVVNDLSAARLSPGRVMLAATMNGLLQIEDDDEVLRFLPGYDLTTITPSQENNGRALAGTAGGRVLRLAYDGYEWLVSGRVRHPMPGPLREIRQQSEGEWWLLTAAPASLVRMRCTDGDTTFILYGREQGVGSDTINSLALIGEKLYAATGRGLFCHDPATDSFVRDHELAGDLFDNTNIRVLSATPEGEVIISGYDSRNFDALVTLTSQGHVIFRRQFDFLPDAATRGITYADGTVWLAKGGSLYALDRSRLAFRYGSFSTFFTRIVAGGEKVLLDGTFFNALPQGLRVVTTRQPAMERTVLRHAENSITFEWSTTAFVDEERTDYRYRLDGRDKGWSAWSRRSYRDYTNLPSGKYLFRLKARTITGLEGEELTYAFVVRRPWYISLSATLIYILVAGGLLMMLVSYLNRRLSQRRRRLESLLRQRNEATARGRSETAGLERYAAAVQEAINPSERRLAEACPNSFLLNMPKREVSGDFFWMSVQGDRTLFAVGDCTGHGIRSSLRTTMALSLLEEIASQPEARTTSSMLYEFRRRVSETLGTLPSHEIQSEGTDISLLCIDRARKRVEYSGAAMQCFRVRVMSPQERGRWDRGEFKPNEGTQVSGRYLLETVYGDRVPLGMHLDSDHIFTQHNWKLEKEVTYYLFTDGYSDQFNGVTGKKFMKKNLRKLILDIQGYHLTMQKEILEERLRSWMGKGPQTDDIIIAGLRPGQAGDGAAAPPRHPDHSDGS